MQKEETVFDELNNEPDEQVIEKEPKDGLQEGQQEGDKEEVKPKENRYSKRVRDLNTKYREEERKRIELEQRLAKLEESNKIKEKPDINNYDDVNKYSRDEQKWSEQERERIRQEERQRIRQEDLQAKRKQEIQKAEESFSNRSRLLLKTDPDYRNHLKEVQDVCQDFGTEDVIDLIVEEKEAGADLVAYLGKKPDELMELVNLSPQRRIAKVAKLAAKLEAKPIKKDSSAPDPVRSEVGSAPRQVSSRSAGKHVARKGEPFAERAKRLNGR